MGEAFLTVLSSYTSAPPLCGSQSSVFSLERQSYCGGSYCPLLIPLSRSSRPVTAGDHTASRSGEGVICLYYCSVHLGFCLDHASRCLGEFPDCQRDQVLGTRESFELELSKSHPQCGLHIYKPLPKVMVTFSKNSVSVAGEL